MHKIFIDFRYLRSYHCAPPFHVTLVIFVLGKKQIQRLLNYILQVQSLKCIKFHHETNTISITHKLSFVRTLMELRFLKHIATIKEAWKFYVGCTKCQINNRVFYSLRWLFFLCKTINNKITNTIQLEKYKTINLLD